MYMYHFPMDISPPIPQWGRGKFLNPYPLGLGTGRAASYTRYIYIYILLYTNLLCGYDGICS